MPFSIIGSTDDVVTADGRTVKGRQYSWGVAEGKEKEDGSCRYVPLLSRENKIDS